MFTRFKFFSSLIFLFLLANNIAYSQGGEYNNLMITGRIVNYTYPSTNSTNNTLPIPVADLNGGNISLSIRLIGPIDHPEIQSTTRTQTTDDGIYGFSGLPSGVYYMVIQTNNAYKTFYWDHAPNDSRPIPMNPAGTETDTIVLNLNDQNLAVNNIYAQGIPMTLNMRIDSVGYYNNATAYSIAGIEIMARSNYRNFNYWPPRPDTIFTTSYVSSPLAITANNNANTSNITFSDTTALLSSGYWRYSPQGLGPDGLGATSFHTIEGFGINITANSHYNAYLNSASGVVTRTSNFRYIIDVFSIAGVIRLGNATGPLLSGIKVNLTGPGEPKDVFTNASGAYNFPTSESPTRENPTNYFYDDYVITPESDAYDFDPPTITIHQKTTTTQFTGNFTATLKWKMISGTCYNGTNPVNGITIYIDSLNADNVTWTRVATLITDSDGKYSSLRYMLGTYKIIVEDPSHTYAFYPTEQIFERIVDDRVQDFFTSSGRHWISGTVTDITDGINQPKEGIIIEITGVSYSSSTATNSNGEYTFIVPNNDTYKVRPKVTPGAAFTPEEYDNVTSNSDVSGLNFSVEFIVPILVSPADNSVLAGKDVHFTWHKTTGANNYYIEYSSSSTFNNILGWSNRGPLDSDTVFSTIVPDYNTTYYWRVKATRNGVESPYSEIWSFRSGLDKPILVSPTNRTNVLTQTPTLTWDAVAGASKYSLALRDSATGIAIQYDDIQTTSWNSPTLIEKDSYFWKIIAYNSAGVASNTSDEWSFYVLRAGYKISGTITKASGDPVQGVAMTLNNSGNTFPPTITNSFGYYEFNNVPTYSNNTITASLSGYSFDVNSTPPDYSTNTADDIRNDMLINFIATPTQVTISGVVHDDDGTSITGAVVECNNGTHITSVITGGDGAYSFPVHSDSNYVITPVVIGKIFNPYNRAYQNPLLSHSNQNFKAEENAFTLSGYVKHSTTSNGIKDAVIGIVSSDDPNETILTLTDANGRYLFTALGGRNYTLTANKKGYTISSTNTAINADGNPQRITNVVATPTPTTIADFITSVVNRTIRGIVYDYENNPLANVIVEKYTNDALTERSSTTNTGAYIFDINIDNTYKVVPIQGGTIFNPSERIYNYPDTNYIDQNFYSLHGGTYVVSGYVYDITNGANIALGDVMISYECATCTPVVSGITMTNSDGYYTFPSETAAIFAIRPIKDGYTIETATSSSTIRVGPVHNNVTADELYATKNKFTLGGIVTSAGLPLQGVLLTVTGSGAFETPDVITGGNGAFSFIVEALGNYTITPSLAGFVFNPSNHTELRVLANNPNINFNAIAINFAPQLVAPINGTLGVDINPTFKWLGLAGATSYNLQYSTTYNFSANITTVSNITDVESQITGLASNTTYYWRVSANLQSTVSNWSEIWSFRTAGGRISWNPSFINFDSILLGKTKTMTVTITDQGAIDLSLFSAVIEGNDKAHFRVNFNYPVNIPTDQSYDITVTFEPNNEGPKNAELYISHNDASTQNPIIIPLFGTGMRTLANIGPFADINFGNLVLNSGVETRTIEFVNNSPYTNDDILTLTNAYFETTPSLFRVFGTDNFPNTALTIAGGATSSITVTFIPNELGLKENYLHIINSSANMPDARIRVRANVWQGNLVVDPSSIDFGALSTGYKNEQVTIQNRGLVAVTITDMYLSGDEAFILLNDAPITLQSGETDFVTIRFFPRSLGRKTGVFNIINDYPSAPHISVPLTGMAGYGPHIYTEIQEIDFGTMYRGTTKDTTLTISNIGVADLYINSSSFLGTNPDIFSILSPARFPIIIPEGGSQDITIRATATLPNEDKSAQLQFTNNDPNNRQYIVDLKAKVTSSVLTTNINDNRIVFDSIALGYYQDSLLILKNEGNIVCDITKFELAGAYSSDFAIDIEEVPFSLEPGESKTVSIRFKPLALGQRYAIINITTNNPVNPNMRITLQGWGINPSSFPTILFEGEGKNEWDFGAVLVRETKTQELTITNFSKYSTLRIDNMKIDFIEKQPFSYGDIEFPLYINSGAILPITLSFTPNDAVRYYESFLTIQHSDSVTVPDPDSAIKILLKGSVIFPNVDYTGFPRVLEFGRVNQGQYLEKEFKIHNHGMGHLTVDSIVIVGEDAAEFFVNDTKFPIKIEVDSVYINSVTFVAGKIGSKDSKLFIYHSDLFSVEPSGATEVTIVAESKLPDSSAIGITKLDEIPTIYNLSQNYPNPFNPTTKVEYSLPESTRVRLSVYNSLGQEVINLVNDFQSAGKYRVDLNAKNLPSGIYFYRLQSDKFTAVKKMMLVK